MKKILLFLLVLCFGIFLVSCGEKVVRKNSSVETNQSESKKIYPGHLIGWVICLHQNVQ